MGSDGWMVGLCYHTSWETSCLEFNPTFLCETYLEDEIFIFKKKPNHIDFFFSILHLMSVFVELLVKTVVPNNNKKIYKETSHVSLNWVYDRNSECLYIYPKYLVILIFFWIWKPLKSHSHIHGTQ